MWDAYDLLINKTLNIISNFNNNVVFMLWGENAKSYKHLIDSKKHLILEHSHPAFAARNNTDWNCKHFTECNEYLRKNKIYEIVWR